MSLSSSGASWPHLLITDSSSALEGLKIFDCRHFPHLVGNNEETSYKYVACNLKESKTFNHRSSSKWIILGIKLTDCLLIPLISIWQCNWTVGYAATLLWILGEDTGFLSQRWSNFYYSVARVTWFFPPILQVPISPRVREGD